MSDKVSGLSIPFRIDTASGGMALQSDKEEKLKENIINTGHQDMDNVFFQFFC